MEVIVIPQLADNYAYLVVDPATRAAAVVDCAEAQSVAAALRTHKVDLVAILPTHHHYDHVGGHEDLLRQFRVEVYGFKGDGHRIPGCTREVGDGETIGVGNLAAQVLYIPAHTSGHVAYYFPAEAAVFTGDTLFAGGCGRLFEGEPAMMIRSLSKLMALPDDTAVYFGHEYTEKNLRFALTLEPGNEALRARHAWACEQQALHHPTTPTTIGAEKATNPFLRWTSPELRQHIADRFPGLALDDVTVFAQTRALKDAF